MFYFPGKLSLALRRCPYSSKTLSVSSIAYCLASCLRNCSGVPTWFSSVLLCPAPSVRSGQSTAGRLPESTIATAGRLAAIE